MESVGYAGSALIFISFIWIAVLAFQAGDVLWGIACLFCPGIVALIYGILNFERAKIPVILLIIGIVVGGAGHGSALF